MQVIHLPPAIRSTLTVYVQSDSTERVAAIEIDNAVQLHPDGWQHLVGQACEMLNEMTGQTDARPMRPYEIDRYLGRRPATQAPAKAEG